MKKIFWCSCLATAWMAMALKESAMGSTLASATFDVDSYIHMGTNAYGLQDDDREGLALGEDYSGGVLINPETNKPNSHIVFVIIEFDELASIQTRSHGGPNKYLTLTTSLFTGASIVGVSVAMADIDSDSDGYPIPVGQNPPFFPGNPTGGPVDRLQWYFDHIKGDDPAYGGYAGGAIHLGILNVTEPGSYSIDVTDMVDAWIEGSISNFGFGLWGVEVPGMGPGQTLEFASMENEVLAGPTLESLPVGGILPGDSNTDGDVDGGDFLAWQAGFGMQEGATIADGDADQDGDVDRDDFLIWEGNFGLAISSGTSSMENGMMPSGTAQIPEPRAIGLALLLAAGSLGVIACDLACPISDRLHP